jgi:two-component system response regulator FixJ
MPNIDATVFILDSDPTYREQACQIVLIVGMRDIPFATPEEFLETTDKVRPNCIVVNCRLPGMGGLTLQSKLQALNCEIPLIMVTDISGNVSTAVRAMKNGAFSYLEKPISEEHLIEKIQICVAQGIKRNGFQISKTQIRKQLGSLTNREREILDQCLLGHSNKVVAFNLGVSVKAIEARRALL